MAGRTALVSYAESSHAIARSLSIDTTNNPGADVSGRPLRVCGGRVADRPRLPSWGAGLGADLVCCERSGGTARYWRSAQALVWVPAWSVRIEGSERDRLLVTWLVFRWCRGRRFALCREYGRGVPGRLVSLCGMPDDPDIAIRRAVALGHRYVTFVGDGRRWFVTARRSLVTGRIAQQHGTRVTRDMRGFGAIDGYGPRNARWRRERVGRAVICDVAIRATLVRCPHKQNPEPRNSTRIQRLNHESVVATSRSASPSSHPPHPDPRGREAEKAAGNRKARAPASTAGARGTSP